MSKYGLQWVTAAAFAVQRRRKQGSSARGAFSFAVLAMASLLAGGCMEPAVIDEVDGVVSGSISGVVYKGLLEGGNVTILAAGEGQWDEVVAEGLTDAAGIFDVEIGLGRGNLLVEVTGGVYVEEATGDPVGLGPRALKAWVPAFEIGDHREQVQVNPVTTLAVAYTKWRMEALDEDFVLAERRASRLLEEHFAGAEWRSTLPSNPTTRRDIPFSDEAIMGVLIAGLSWQALEMASQAGTASRAVNSSALVELLAEDLRANGKLDGVGRSGRTLALHGQVLDCQTLRLRYALAILRFLSSERNVSGLARDDIEETLYRIANRDSEIFASPPGAWHLDPPTIEVEHPSTGSAVRGLVEISARATDVLKVTDLGFSEPAELWAADPIGRGQASASISAQLDTTIFQDGPLSVGLFSENDRGLRSEKEIELIVSNTTPLVHIDQPSEGEVSGIVEIVAWAEPNPLTGAKITEVRAVTPSGLDDVSGVAKSLEARWDTTEELEGAHTIEVVAVDELGSEGNARLTVEVVNREPLHIDGLASIAGRPIADAVVTALALDMPSDSDEPGFVQVGSTRTDDAGRFTLTITDRNYEGPLSVRVGQGGSWTSPIGGRSFSTSSSRHISSYLPSPSHLHIAGEQPLPLVVGSWSTLADRLARYYSIVSPGSYSPMLAWARAEEMIAGHFARPTALSLHTSPTHDITSEERSLQDSQLTLADMGLAWMLRDRQDVSALDLVYALAEDIATGKFDGDDGNLAIPAVGDTKIDVDTTRLALAVAIYEFTGSNFNQSGISPADLMSVSSSGGQSYLDRITTDAREIYGSAGSPFDQTGPSITWIRPEPDTLFGGETIIIEAFASDVTGLRAFSVIEPSIDGEPLLDESGVLETVRARLPNSVPPNVGDYGVRVGLLAEDRLGNTTTSYLHLSRKPPTVLIEKLDVLLGGSWVAAEGPTRGMLRLDASATGGFATERFGIVSPDPSLEAIGADLDGNALSLRHEIDTAGLPDGLLEVRVCHATVEGREACDEVGVLVDNSPPQLQATLSRRNDALEGWFGCVDPFEDCPSTFVAFDYVCSDATSGVAEVRLGGSGFSHDDGYVTVTPEVVPHDHGECVGAPCEGSIGVELKAGSYELFVEAVDRAGNAVSSEPVSVTVATRVPSLEDGSGSFDNENQMDFVRVGQSFQYVPRQGHEPYVVADALGGSAAWKKMEHRLSAATLSEAHLANIPVILVNAAGGVDGEAGLDDPTVEYLYQWLGDDGSFAESSFGWREMMSLQGPPHDEATHALPLSVEWLGEELAGRLEHRVRVRVRDRAGNRAENVYSFRLDLVAAPVVMEIDRGYPVSGDPESIYHYGFAQRNLDRLFGGRPFEDGRARAARFVIHQPHYGFVVRVSTELLDDIELRRSRRQLVVTGEILEHPCVFQVCYEGPWGEICEGCAEHIPPDPANDDPPCVNHWSQPNRAHLYKVYREEGDLCLDRRLDVPMGAMTESFSVSTGPADIALYDEHGGRVVAKSDGAFNLPRGTYFGYVRVPVTDDFFTSVLEVHGATVYGQLREVRRVVHQSHSVRWVERPEADGCVQEFSCVGHDTRGEEVVRYETAIEWAGTGGDDGGGVVTMYLQTGSMNPVITEWRDPMTGIVTEEKIPKTLDVSHVDEEAQEP